MQVIKHSRQEVDYERAIYDKSGDLVDIAQLTGKTPFDELLTKEERALLSGDDHREAQIEALSGLLGYILKDTDPLQVAIRVFLLGYTIKPELVDGMTLAQLGKRLGGLSKQRLNTKLKAQDKWLGYQGRNRKSAEQRKAQSISAKKMWRKRKRA
jgi:hypothetical protein